MLSTGEQVAHARGHRRRASKAAEKLRADLKDWKQGMFDLAARYQNLQRHFNVLANSHSEGLSRTIRMWTSFKCDVEAMVRFQSCRRASKMAASSKQQAAAAECKSASDALLQVMLKHADDVVGWLDSSVQQLRAVLVEQDMLVLGVDRKIYEMANIQDDASSMAAAANSDMLQDARNLQHADTTSGSRIVAGGAVSAVFTGPACAFAGPAAAAACAAWPVLSGAAGVAGLVGTTAFTKVERAHHETALMQSAQVHNTLTHLHGESIAALKGTMAVCEVLVKEADWLESLQSLATAARRVVEDVVEIITSDAYMERQVVLRELATAAADMVHMLGRLSGGYQQGLLSLW
jgi:hypothetical protein